MISAFPVGRIAKRIVFATALAFSLAAPAAAQQNAAQLAVQVQEMQEQIRLLTGQVEGLQFQLTQMQTLLERMTEDNEFRFQQLEGGAGGKPQAATEPGAAPAQQLPQTQTETGSIQQLPAQPDALPQLSTDGLPGDGEPMDFDLGDSQDPMLNGGQGTLGSLDEGVNLGGSRPLDLTFDSGKVSSGDARAQYDAGYEAIVQGDYAFAEEQFQQFVALYPDDPQAPDATNWLGEALIQQGKYDDAALVLAEGYKKYEADKRAPDLMLKLGTALNGTDQKELACRTFVTLEKRFLDLSTAFRQRLSDEKSKAQCPA
ncbi:MAG: tol-pal system protein YbgF [Hyphomicrobiales bacterium]|nr:MAG: tol-pal system protein YbgF [Hyphomicrobiales bacterium]